MTDFFYTIDLFESRDKNKRERKFSIMGIFRMSIRV